MASSISSDAAVVLGSLALFVVAWSGTYALSLYMAGWNKLAKLYPSNGEKGDVYMFASGGVRRNWLVRLWLGYSLRVTIADDGLGLCSLFVPRFLARPIFVLWTSINSIEKTNRFFSTYTIDIRNTLVRLNLCGEAARAARRAFLRGVRSRSNNALQPTRGE